MTSIHVRAGLRWIACGGTFDKRYDPLTGALVFAGTQLPAIVERARLTIPVEIEALMQIDSLDMRPDDRERVLAACRAAPERAIVVTHGTDTMPDTAAVIGTHFANADAGVDGDGDGDGGNDDDGGRRGGKTIVLTGAMVPYAITGSDALFNLGFACAAAQTLPVGVWIAMNGRVHRWDDVRKNREAGVFESLGRAIRS